MRRRRRRTEPDAQPSPAARVLAAVPDRRPQPPAPRSPIAPPADVAALVAAEVARLRAAEQEAAAEAQRRQLDHPEGGGCADCGISWSGRRQLDGTVTREWHGGSGHWVCAWCSDDLDDWPDSDDDRRVRQAARLIGVARADGRLHRRPMTNMSAVTGAMRWWRETPGAQPSEARWAYVDVEQLRAAWAAAVNPTPPAPVELATGEPCQRCGVADRYVVEPAHQVDTPHGSYTQQERRHCTGCGRGAFDVDAVVSAMVREVTGHRLVPGIASVLGCKRFKDSGRRRPARSPFDWWGTPDEIRARARALWPDRRAFREWRWNGRPPGISAPAPETVGAEIDALRDKVHRNPGAVTDGDVEEARRLAARYEQLQRAAR